jgi:hypothetical protein
VSGCGEVIERFGLDSFSRQTGRYLHRSLFGAVPNEHAPKRWSDCTVRANQPSRHFSRADNQQDCGLERCEDFRTERGIRCRSPVRDLCAVDDSKGSAVRPVEQDADGLHRGQPAAVEISGKACNQLAGHVPAAIDSMAYKILRLLAAEETVLNFDFRPMMCRLQSGN